VENFMGAAVGSEPGSMTLDTATATWTPDPNSGRVVRVVSEAGGLAQLDADGDGDADAADDAALGLTAMDPEKSQLAALYEPGAELWRLLLPHFSGRCGHLPYLFADGARKPRQPRGKAPGTDACCEKPAGSSLHLEQQALAEVVDLAGTPHRLHYTSERQAGYLGETALSIPLIDDGGVVPGPVARIDLEIQVAGQVVRERFLPSPALPPYVFTWNGRDAYGRLLQGRQPITVRTTYWYPPLGFTGDPVAAFDRADRVFGGQSSTWRGFVGSFDARAAGLGGWTLEPHHAYDPYTEVLYRGDGTKRTAANLPAVLRTVAGGGTNASPPDGLPGTQAQLLSVPKAAVAPDGTVYLAAAGNRIFRLLPPASGSSDWTLFAFAGNPTAGCGGPTSPSGDGGPALAACLDLPQGLAIGPDGSVYVSEAGGHHRVRRILPDAQNTIVRVAGTGAIGFSGDGGPAIAAQLSLPTDVAIDGMGNLYIADSGNARVRRVAPDGAIATVAGTGFQGYGGDNPPAVCHTTEPGCVATATALRPDGLDADRDGNLFVATADDQRVVRISADGYLTLVAGCITSQSCSGGDGDPAQGAVLNGPQDVGVDAQGRVYITELSGARVRRIESDGRIVTVVGTGEPGDEGDGGPGPQAELLAPWSVALSPDGSLFVADQGNGRLRRLEPPLPGFSVGDLLVASADGRELYVFDSTGRHQETRDALTNGLLLAFEYTQGEEAGLLDRIVDARVTDPLRDETVVERDSQGRPTAIVAPFGERTTLAVDAAGYLESIRSPANDEHFATYSPGGLLLTFRRPELGVSTMTYDAEGRLATDQDPVQAQAGPNERIVLTPEDTPASAETEPGFRVTETTAEERTFAFAVATLAGGLGQRIEVTDEAGLTRRTDERLGLDRTTSFADGSTVTVAESADPRFGMAVPVPKRVVVQTPGSPENPGGSRLVASTTRTKTETSGQLATLTDTVVLGEPPGPTRTLTRTFAAGPRTVTTVTPAGRPIVETLDASGRLVSVQVGSLHPVSFTYTAAGRLETVRQGPGGGADRVTTFAYDPATGLLDTITDPELRVVDFPLYDAAGRVLQQILPGNRTVGFGWDRNGNLTSLTPPGRPAHLFRYTPVDLEEEYEPPEATPGEPRITTSEYNLDRQLERVLRPDATQVDLVYEPATNRLDQLVVPQGTVDFGYDPTTGSLTSIAAPGGQTLALGYDGPLLTLQTWSGPVAGSVAHGYDDDLRIDAESVGGEPAIAFGYDGDGLLTQAGALALTPDPSHGLLAATTLGSLTTGIEYTSFGERTSDSASFGATPLYANSYPVRDDLGRILQKVETIQGTTTTFDYTYDPAGRLDRVRANGTLVKDYAYDLNGNRTFEREDLGGAPIAAYDAQDRLTSHAGKIYTYTEAGELETVTEAGQTTTYAYDPLGNLRTVQLPGGPSIEYVIDGMNRRVGKKVNGTLQQGFLWADALRVVAELDGSGAVVSRFVYASRPNVPEYLVKAGSTYRILTDHLGSVRLVVNAATGAVAQRIDYDEFGVVTTDTSPGFQPFGFAGGLYDRDTKLVRFGAREYDAGVGRWAGKEPRGFTSPGENLYLYALGDPVNFVDHDGAAAAAAGAVGVIVGTGASITVGTAVVIGLGVAALGGAVLCAASEGCRREAGCLAQLLADLTTCTGKGLCPSGTTTEETLECFERARRDYGLCRSGLRYVPGGATVRSAPRGNLRPVQ
jgi:RHS repeat-associated protein